MSHEAYDLFKGMHKTRLDPTFGVGCPRRLGFCSTLSLIIWGTRSPLAIMLGY